MKEQKEKFSLSSTEVVLRVFYMTWKQVFPHAEIGFREQLDHNGVRKSTIDMQMKSEGTQETRNLVLDLCRLISRCHLLSYICFEAYASPNPKPPIRLQFRELYTSGRPAALRRLIKIIIFNFFVIRLRVESLRTRSIEELRWDNNNVTAMVRLSWSKDDHNRKDKCED